MPLLTGVAPSLIRTQKALGIRHLLSGGVLSEMIRFKAGLTPLSTEVYLIQSQANVDEAIDYFDLERFKKYGQFIIRPCPAKPAHGFIESEPADVLSFAKMLQEKWDEVMSVDPDGEILIMPMVKADISAIYVGNGHFTFGSGTDGVTGGKDGLSIRVAPAKLTKAQRNAIRVYEGEEPFFEIVYGKGPASPYKQGDYPFVVQARGGPAVPFTKDFIPEDVNVKEVYTASLSIPLTEWKVIVENQLKYYHGLVVYCKDAPISSHIAIHCVAHKVPFFSSFKPEVGSTYAKATEGTDFNSKMFKYGAGLAFQYMGKHKSLASFSRLLKTGIFILRNAPHIMQSPDERAWAVLGFGLEAVALGGALAVIGESRRSVCEILPSVGLSSKPSYWKAWMGRGEEFWNRVGLAAWMLNHENHGSSIGGPRWVYAAVSALKIHNRILQFDEEGFKAALEEANILVDLAHNTGWLLNKFLQKTVLDSANNSPEGIVQFVDVLSYVKTSKLVSPVPDRKYRASDRKYHLTKSGSRFKVHFSIPELSGGTEMSWRWMEFNTDNAKLVEDLIREA